MAETNRSSVIVIREQHAMTPGEVCRCCDLTADQLLEMVGEGLLRPEGADPRRWRFSVADLNRVRAAQRLQRDLGTNLAGAALALELMDEMKHLRARLRMLEHLLR